MKSNSVKFKIFAVVLSVFALAAGCFALTAAKTVVYGEATFAENPFKTVYEYGETLSMPSSLTIVADGNNYTADKGYIRFPDGKTYAGGEITLNAYGEYEVIYEAKSDNKRLTAAHIFGVKKSLYSVDKNSSYELAALNSNFGADVKGLSVTLGAGETFTYNKPVNVYDNPSLELLKFNVMHFEPIGKEIVVRLTDCYDPNNYIDLNYLKVAYSETYLGVGANGKASRGLTTHPNVTGQNIYVDGAAYKINTNGGLIPSNRKKENHAGLTADRYNNMTITLDTANKAKPRVYVQTAPENVLNELIAELNNPDIYNYTFDGFKTGEVYVSITAKTLINETSVKLEIASLCGVSGEALIGDYADVTGPEIVLDSDKTALNVMAGVPISVPAATARDTSGVSGEVEYSVYYAYGTASEKSISVKNGKFIPTDLGKYTAVYTARDVFGNISTKEFAFYAVKEGTEGIDFTCDKVTSAVAGRTVSLAGYSAKSLNSSATVTATLTDPDGKAVAVNSDMTALIEKAGKYTVKYDYFDDLYTGSYEYEFTAADEGVVRFESDKIIAPEYFIKGATYSIEKVTAYKYSAQAPAAMATNYKVSYDGGAFTAIDPDNFTVSAGATLKIRCAYAGDESIYVESGDIKIADVGYKTDSYDMSEYFVGDFTGGADESSSDGVYYNITANGTLNFVNPLLLSDFSIRYSVTNRENIGSYTFILTDYYDRSKTATLKFVGGGVEINGELKQLSYSDSLSAFSVSISGANNVTLGTVPVSCDLGLTSDKILFSVKFDGVTSAAKFNVYSVCNQSFGYYVTSDNIEPIISVAHPDRVAKVGDVITLYKPELIDVLSPSPLNKCTVSVYKDGASVTSVDGVLLKNADAFKGYSFKITDFGSYLILYTYTDGAGKTADDRFAITVTDVISPEITLDGYDGKPVSVSVNKEISPVAFTVKDNVTAKENIKVTIIVYNEKGVAVCASNDKFTLTAAGNYTVYVYCTDEAGNTAYASYQVTAK